MNLLLVLLLASQSFAADKPKPRAYRGGGGAAPQVEDEEQQQEENDQAQDQEEGSGVRQTSADSAPSANPSVPGGGTTGGAPAAPPPQQPAHPTRPNQATPFGGAGGLQPPPEKPKYTCAVPNAKKIVESVLARPGMEEALHRACRHNTDWTFPNAVIDELRKTNRRWGYWCRRGNCKDPSHDVLAYYCGPGTPTENSDNANGVDYISASCYDTPEDGDPKISWSVFEGNEVGTYAWTSRGRFHPSEFTQDPDKKKGPAAAKK